MAALVVKGLFTIDHVQPTDIIDSTMAMPTSIISLLITGYMCALNAKRF